MSRHRSRHSWMRTGQGTGQERGGACPRQALTGPEPATETPALGRTAPRWPATNATKDVVRKTRHCHTSERQPAPPSTGLRLWPAPLRSLPQGLPTRPRCFPSRQVTPKIPQGSPAAARERGEEERAAVSKRASHAWARSAPEPGDQCPADQGLMWAAGTSNILPEWLTPRGLKNRDCMGQRPSGQQQAPGCPARPVGPLPGAPRPAYL